MAAGNYEFEVEYSNQLVADAARLVFRARILTKKRLTFDIALTVLLIVECAYSIWSGQEKSPRGAVVVSVAMIGLLWSVLPFRFWKTSRKMREKSSRLLGKKIKITLTNDEIVFLAGAFESKLKWGQIDLCLTTPDLLFLSSKGKWAILPTSETCDEAKKFVFERINGSRPSALTAKAQI